MAIPEKYFIFVSLFIALIYVVMMILGYRRGFLFELLSLLATAAALVAAWFASPVFASLFPLVDLSEINNEYKLLDQLFNLNKILNNIIYFVILLLILKLLIMIISLIFKGFNNLPVVGGFNKILGSAFGFFNATIIVICLSILLSTPLFKNGNEVREKTILHYITDVSDEVLETLVEKIGTENKDELSEDFDVSEYREQFKEWLISVSNDE